MKRVSFHAAVNSRWSILSCACVISFAQDFVQDVPSYDAFFTAYTWSSAFSAVTAAITMGRYGSRFVLWSSNCMMVAGSVLFVLGSYATTSTAYPIMMTGRVLFGIGNGASITVCGNLVSAWFVYHELGLSSAINTVFGRLGSATNFLLVGGVLSRIGMSGCLWIALGLTIAAWISAIILGQIDETNRDPTQPTAEQHFNMIYRIFMGLGWVFWSFCVVYFIIHGVVTTFTSNASTMLLIQQNYTEAEASYAISLVNAISLGAPIIGYLLDLYGQRDYWLTAGVAIIFLAFLGYMTITGFPPYLLTVGIGLGFAIFDPTASSATSLLSPEDAGGIANSVQKFFRYVAVGVLTAAAGVMLDRSDQMSIWAWQRFLVMLISLLVVAVIAAIAMVVFNCNDDKHPLSPTKHELEIEHEDAIESEHRSDVDEQEPLLKKSS